MALKTTTMVLRQDGRKLSKPFCVPSSGKDAPLEVFKFSPVSRWWSRGGQNLHRVLGVVLSLSFLFLGDLGFPEAVGAQARVRLENPQPDSAQSGLGVISGWACEAQQIEIEFNNDPANRWRAGTRTRRPDTLGVCGDTDNGFGLLFNWNRLGDGTHTVRAFADGVEFANVVVIVTTLGKEFAQGLTHDVTLPDFPEEGTDVVLTWQQAQQNFVIASAGTTSRLVEVTPTLVLPPGVSIPNVTISSLYADGAEVAASPEPSLLLAVDADGTVLLAIADQDGGLLGEAPGVVEVSVDSTAVTLVGLLAGIAVHDMTPSVVADIQAHAQYQALIAAMRTALAADKNFLDRLYALPAIVDRLRQIAASLPTGPQQTRRPATATARRVATVKGPSGPSALLQSFLDAVACLTPTAHAQEGGSSDPDCAHKRAKTLEIIGLTTVDMIFPVKDTIAVAEAIRDMPSVGQPFLTCAIDRTATWVAEHPGQTPPLLPEWNVRPDENIAVGFIVDNFEALTWQYDVLWPCIAATPSQSRNAADKMLKLVKNVALGRVLKGAKAAGKLRPWLHALYERVSRGKRFLDFIEELDELESEGCTGPVNAAGQLVRVGERGPLDPPLEPGGEEVGQFDGAYSGSGSGFPTAGPDDSVLYVSVPIEASVSGRAITVTMAGLSGTGSISDTGDVVFSIAIEGGSYNFSGKFTVTADGRAGAQGGWDENAVGRFSGDWSMTRR